MHIRFPAFAKKKLRALFRNELQSIYPRTRTPATLAKVCKDSLLWYYSDLYSQRGQDGILGEIFRRLKVDKGYFVEFGAWDGLFLANSRFLFEKGWGGAFIEADANRCEELRARYAPFPQVNCIQGYVGAPSHVPGSKSLRELLASSGVDPNQVTFASIDVDGMDLEIFEDMEIRPAVVLIEGGFMFNPKLSTRLPMQQAARFNQPLPTIVNAGKALGYSPVCFLQDTYFVRDDLLTSELRERSVDELYRDAWWFIDDELREELVAARRNDPDIPRIEKSAFGSFNAEPLATT